MASDPVSDFAWKELAPVLTERVRVRFAEQCAAYLRLRAEESGRPPPLPFDMNDEYDVRLEQQTWRGSPSVKLHILADHRRCLQDVYQFRPHRT
jgi:hypothetical protein